jgi:hypothetical protein
LHTGHHGAQNQKTAGLPARLAPSNVPPSIVEAAKSSASGTTGTPDEVAAEVGSGVGVGAGAAELVIADDGVLAPEV